MSVGKFVRPLLLITWLLVFLGKASAAFRKASGLQKSRLLSDYETGMEDTGSKSKDGSDEKKEAKSKKQNDTKKEKEKKEKKGKEKDKGEKHKNIP
mmetsp:Transcript_19667/g.33590  ORF Transcript_19667/g.33590 Transcript_19667/m.33590 type:complete len:96 (+) Transcript_19667:108-395(+)